MEKTSVTGNPKSVTELMRHFVDGQPIGDIRPNIKRHLAFWVDDKSLSDADFREAVRLAVMVRINRAGPALPEGG